MSEVVKYCVAPGCPSQANSRQVKHAIMGVEYPCGTAPNWRLKCSECGEERHMVIPTTSKKKRTWPYYNESTGVNFESESHEKQYVKDNNMIAL